MVHSGGGTIPPRWDQQRADQILPRGIPAGREIRCRGGRHHQFPASARPLHHFKDRTYQAVVPLERPAHSPAFHSGGDWRSETIPVPKATPGASHQTYQTTTYGSFGLTAYPQTSKLSWLVCLRSGWTPRPSVQIASSRPSHHPRLRDQSRS
jgi:hypothetical protein